MTDTASLPAGRPLARLNAMIAGRPALLRGGAALLLGFAGYGALQASTQVAEAAGLTPAAAAQAERLQAMEHKVARMQARVATIRTAAQQHAERIEQRQELLAAALTGQGDAKRLALATLAVDPQATRVAADTIRPFLKVEGRQAELAQVAERQLLERYTQTARQLRQRGIAPSRIARGASAMGGPLVEATSAEARADMAADQQFRSLFMTWKKLDKLEQGVIAIPSVQPVQKLNFTSNFGIRSDPFRGTAAMHAGVDIPGPTGTPIYATADGIISHAGRQGGYGNMVEINHGKGIATRYGHLSKIIVADHTRVKRGQLIALMGSTGRSTGPHLHYEVRIDGHAVNPVPFLTTADYLMAAQDRAVGQIPVSTSGPAPQD
ncbi:murein DD-endopeptidase MepM/ murein hydrolase activator NlpD [Sphingomonas sp. BE138]|uniref:M23 family metallopeptidase n=1 Tax=Sphingomonas sp. BE138 TaxID=2817845 RepID=UPI002865CEEB|nr:M23 family metallopeptidase [Sphingomonas sp. BE138]MDR6789408.1 murein DD-endopeptidase MepM/ murein hydrolase activator NlpD [Sphingomonas sp. BE138]